MCESIFKDQENKYEKACKEFLKGCSCTGSNNQESCPECLKAFCDYIRKLKKAEDDELIQEEKEFMQRITDYHTYLNLLIKQNLKI